MDSARAPASVNKMGWLIRHLLACIIRLLHVGDTWSHRNSQLVNRATCSPLASYRSLFATHRSLLATHHSLATRCSLVARCLLAACLPLAAHIDAVATRVALNCVEGHAGVRLRRGALWKTSAAWEGRSRPLTGHVRRVGADDDGYGRVVKRGVGRKGGRCTPTRVSQRCMQVAELNTGTVSGVAIAYELHNEWLQEMKGEGSTRRLTTNVDIRCAFAHIGRTQARGALDGSFKRAHRA